MNDYLEKISHELKSIDIEHDCYHDCIHIQLPNIFSFGILEIKIWNGMEDSIQLRDSDFHTHGEIVAAEFSLSREKAIAALVGKIFSGEYLLIEEKAPNKKPRKLIAQSLDNFLRYLPKGTEYSIKNKI